VIPKVRKGKGFAGVLGYALGPGREETHKDPHVIASAMLAADLQDPRAIAREMRQVAGRGGRVERPVLHVSLRAAPDDRRLDDVEWAQIAGRFTERMGLGDCPWVAVRHAEDHIHLIASRVSVDGRTVSSHNDYERAHQAARQAEAEHGLIDATSRSGPLATVTRSERDSAKRRGAEPERARLRMAIERVRDQCDGTRPDFERRAREHGVMLRANQSAGGKMNGYSFSLEGWQDPAGEQVWLTASKVHRSLAWKQLDGALAARREQHRTPAPAQSRHPAKAALAAHDARREDLERALAALPIAKLDRLDDLAARRRALREAATKVGEQLAALGPAPRWRADRHERDRQQLARGLGEHERALAALGAEHRQLAEQLHGVDPAPVRQQHATLTSQLAEHHKQRDVLEAAALVAAAHPDPGHQLPPGSTDQRYDPGPPTRVRGRDGPGLGR
jgi:hypothetical protein